MDTYVITEWTDKNGHLCSGARTVLAHNLAEAKAKFKRLNHCRSVQAGYKK